MVGGNIVPGSVGFIGTGLMGAPMAGRLLDHGVSLVVYNRTPEKAEGLRSRGARPAIDPLAVAREADLICLMLQDADAVNAVLDPPGGMMAALGPGKTIVNFSTIGPVACRYVLHRIEDAGAAYLDAPVLGSITPAAEGKLLIFAGGSEEVLQRCRPLLEILAKRIFPTGPAGSASAAKLVMNMLLARYVEALGEVLALSGAFQLSPRQLFEIIQASALASPMWDKSGPLLEGSPPVHFPLRHMVKDLGLLDEELDRLGLAFPAAEAVYGSFLEALLAGRGERDYSELALHIAGKAAPAQPGPGSV